MKRWLREHWALTVYMVWAAFVLICGLAGFLRVFAHALRGCF